MIQEPISILESIPDLYNKYEDYFKGPPLGIYSYKYCNEEHYNFIIKSPKIQLILISIKEEIININSIQIKTFICLVRSVFGSKIYKINQDHLIKNSGMIQDCLRVLWGIFIQDITNDFYPIDEEEILKTVKSTSLFSKFKNLMTESDDQSNETVSGSVLASIKTSINVTEILENLKEKIKKKPVKYSFDKILKDIIMIPSTYNKSIESIEENIMFPIQSVNILVSDLKGNFEYLGSPIRNEFFPPEISKINVKNKNFDILKIQSRFYDLFYSEQSYVMQLLDFYCFYSTLFNKEDLDTSILSIKSLVYQKIQDILLLHIDLLYQLNNIIREEKDLKTLNLNTIYQLMKTEKLFSNKIIKEKIDEITDKTTFKKIGKRITEIFEYFLPKFSIYQSYITNSYDISEIIKNDRFLQSVSLLILRKEEIIKSDFNQIIIIPLHRLSRYKLYFEDIESLLHTNSLINIIIKISTFDNLIHKKREEAIRLKKNVKLYSLINNMPQQTEVCNLFLLQINLEKYLNNSPLSLFLDSSSLIFTKRIGPRSDIFDKDNDTSYEFIKKVNINNLKLQFKDEKAFLIIKTLQQNSIIKLPGSIITVSGENQIETLPLISSNLLIIEQFMRTIELYKNSEITLKSKHYVNLFNLKNKNQKIFYHIYNAKQYIKSQMNSKNIILLSEKTYSSLNSCQSKFIIKSDKLVCSSSSLVMKIFKEENYIINIESSKNIKFSDFSIAIEDFENLFNKIITKIFNIHHIASPIEESDNLILFKQLGILYNKIKLNGDFNLIQPINYLSGICYINSIRRCMNYCINYLKTNSNKNYIFDLKIQPNDYNSILKLKSNHEKKLKENDLNILLSIITIYFKKSLYEILTYNDIYLMGLCIKEGIDFVKKEFPIDNKVIPKKFLKHFFYLKNEYFIIFLRFFSNYYSITKKKNFFSFFQFILRSQNISDEQIDKFIDEAILGI